MHGTEHTLDEDMDDHPNGRCSMVPITVSMADLGIDAPETGLEVETGESWFRGQPESVQREMMGPGKYEAWRAGRYEFDALVTQSSDPRWGTTRTETTLEALVGGGG
jgi:hypothetical protein